MSAAVLLGPSQVTTVEVPDPVPGRGEALVQTLFAGVCGSDGDGVFGSILGFSYPGPPGAPGHETVGTIVHSPDDAFAPGDLVLALPSAPRARALADLQVLPAQAILRADPAMEPLDLLMAQQLGTAIYALKDFWPDRPGQIAAVFGAGPAGLHFVQVLKRRGFETVVSVNLSPARLAVAQRRGADVTIQAIEADPASAIEDHTSGAGAALVVEAAGRDETGRRRCGASPPRASSGSTACRSRSAQRSSPSTTSSDGNRRSECGSAPSPNLAWPPSAPLSGSSRTGR